VWKGECDVLFCNGDDAGDCEWDAFFGLRLLAVEEAGRGHGAVAVQGGIQGLA
jgi:hypothetical protein